MKTIETTAIVGDDRKVVVQLPADVAPGPHQIVVVVDMPRPEPARGWTMDDWPVHDAALVDPNFSMRREELHGDSGH